MVKRVLAACALAFACHVGCRQPTEIVVDVTTDFPCSALASTGVAIRVGASSPLSGPASTVSTTCANKFVGTLVLTPSGRGDGVVVEAIAALAPASLDAQGSCTEGTSGCIHARRAVSFASGAAVTVPIQLQASCAGVLCAPSETCVSGTCTASTPDAGVDAEPDADADAAPQLPPPACGDTSTLLAKAAWPMDHACPGHAGVSAHAGPPAAPTKRWAVPTGFSTPQTSMPVQVVIDANDVMYFLSKDGTVHSVANGTGMWSHAAQGTPLNGTGGLLLGTGGKLYIANDSSVVAVDAASGSQMPPANTIGGAVRSTLNGGPAGLYLSDANAQIETFTIGSPLVNGNATQQFLIQGSIDGIAPTLFANAVYIGDSNGVVYTFDPTSMSRIEPDIPAASGKLATFAAAPDGTLRSAYVQNGTGHAISYDPVKRAVVWDKTIPVPVTNPVVAAVTGDGTAYVTSDDRFVAIFDASGASKTLAGNVHPILPAVDSAGAVYTTDAAGNLVAYSHDLGVIWSSTLNVTAWAIYVGTQHDLFVVTDTQIQYYE